MTMSTESSGVSSSSASICGREVIGPWPISILPVKQVTRPSSPMRRKALKSEGRPRPPRWRPPSWASAQSPSETKMDAPAQAFEKLPPGLRVQDHVVLEIQRYVILGSHG